ncbi:hypothetical protein HHK36_009569 [Tetracentron sinense]|uniref:PHD-type zinc finger plants domain-containing protein n=1 Tax=Tetracentron sinense TaxID=13715 RepID=A0A834ZDK3_TETSI|nr:hypothetical protein HHK36_009569 [Tetracentron sinense]
MFVVWQTAYPSSLYLSLTRNRDMTTGKGGVAPSSTTLECCMCGDYGLSYELFRCKVCQFRSQHRYCSDLYPKAESYRVCNWCLNKKGGKGEGTHNLSPSSTYSNSNEDENTTTSTKKKTSSDNHVALKVQRGALQLHLNNPIKKQRSLELRSSSIQKKIIASGCMEETLRRTKSEEMSNSGITRQVFKGKVRRYKLLDEVSS